LRAGIVRRQCRKELDETRRLSCSDFRDDVPVPRNCSVSGPKVASFGWSLGGGQGVFKLPIKATIYSFSHHLSPFISTPQDDSKQCEHLLSQEIRRSCSDLSRFISPSSHLYLPKSPTLALWPSGPAVAKLGNREGKHSKTPKIDVLGCF
jgi:hypothetical protein